ncbi:MAG: AAA family ATPase [Defluviitaleaceae bacterium]|nr:AAA family ATPase [Defluviitaleaceae bacterium]
MLKPLSTIFGMNDSGKSNLLLALSLALTNRGITASDVFCSKDTEYSQDTKVIIDLKFVPIGKDEKEKDKKIKNKSRNQKEYQIKDKFDGSWADLLTDSVQTDENDKQFFAFRTQFIYNQDKQEYTKKHIHITLWNDEKITVNESVSGTILSAFNFIYIDAHRDIAEDIRNKSSAWNRQLAKMEIADEPKQKIENSLLDLSKQIVQESSFLKKATENLGGATNVAGSQIEIYPITRNIEEIYKGLDIFVTQSNSSAISMSNMGAGTRSRAIFATTKTVIGEKIGQSKETPLFFMVAFEEPEVHIHPQAQKKLIKDFQDMQVQGVITTHSPYVLETSDIQDLIYTTMQDAETYFRPTAQLNLPKEELDKIKRIVIDTHGAILFAKAVVLAEGDTEKIALPIFFKEYFNNKRIKYEHYELGVDIIGVGGTNYLPFLKLLKIIEVDWLIFSDGEPQILEELRNLIKELDDKKEFSDYKNIVVLDNNYNYEQYLVNSGYADDIIKYLDEFDGRETGHKLSNFENDSKKYCRQKNAKKKGMQSLFE